MIDFERLLTPISPAKPCGDDPADTVRGVEFCSQMDKLLGGAFKKTDAEWKLIKKTCEDFLLLEAKYLSAAVILSVAELELGGLSELNQGLTFILALLDRFWDQLHPNLERGPDERVQCFLTFCQPGEQSDRLRVHLRLLQQPLFQSAEGKITAESIHAAESSLAERLRAAAKLDKEVSDAEKKSYFEKIRAVAAQTTEKDREPIGRALVELRKTADAIRLFLLEKLPDAAPNWDPFFSRLEDLGAQLRKYPPSPNAAPAAALESAGPSAGITPWIAPQTLAPSQASVPPGAGGSAASREFAMQCLEQACVYFERQEPSSPVPVLLRRAQKLAGQNFLEIIRILNPEVTDPLRRLHWDDTEASKSAN